MTTIRPRKVRALRLTRHLLVTEKLPLLMKSLADFTYEVHLRIRLMIENDPHRSAADHLRWARHIWTAEVQNESAATLNAIQTMANRTQARKYFDLNAEDLAQKTVEAILRDSQRFSWRTANIRRIFQSKVNQTAREMTSREHRETGRDPWRWNVDRQALPLDDVDPMDPMGRLLLDDEFQEFAAQHDEASFLPTILDDLIGIVDSFYPDETDLDRFNRTILLRAKLEGMSDQLTARLLRGGVLPNSISVRRRRLYDALLTMAEAEWSAGSEDRWVIALHNRALIERKISNKRRDLDDEAEITLVS